MRLTVPDIKMLQQVAERIDKDFSCNYSVSDLAGLAHMSESRFKQAFHAMFGQPVHRYIIQRKLAFAFEKIQEDELTLAQIARLCGYRHTTNFIAAFKKTYGYTPATVKPRQNFFN